MDRTIVALSTPAARGAIAVVRLSGPDSVAVAERVFRSRSGKTLSALAGYTALYGDFLYGNELLDDGVALVFRAPKSFTGEDMAELSCHGNPAIAERLVAACVAAGAQPAAHGEFTRRAFENGKIDLAEAEAVAELIAAESEGARRAALGRKNGAVSREVFRVREELSLLMASLAVWSDYPEETDAPDLTRGGMLAAVGSAKESLRRLADGHRAGKYLQNGVTVAIVGRPNAGKSTLLNRLLGEERSIVTSKAGTTRDVIEARTSLGSVPLRLLDTAGIRETDDEIERIGVERAREALQSCDAAVAVFDRSRPFSEEDAALLREAEGRPFVAALNKIDLPDAGFPQLSCECVEICAKDGAGLDRLGDAILHALGASLTQGGALIASERQYGCILRAIAALEETEEALASGITLDAAGVLVDEALGALGELTGQSASELTLEQVFSRFCVGK